MRGRMLCYDWLCAITVWFGGAVTFGIGDDVAILDTPREQMRWSLSDCLAKDRLHK